MWKPYSSTLPKSGNHILPLQKGVETLLPHIYNVPKPYSPLLLRLQTLLPHFYKVWKPYSPTFTRCGNLIPPYLECVQTLLPHIYKVWKPYSRTFTTCGNLIPHIYWGWNPYSPTFTRCGNLIPPHLPSVETSFTIPILKVCLCTPVNTIKNYGTSITKICPKASDILQTQMNIKSILILITDQYILSL